MSIGKTVSSKMIKRKRIINMLKIRLAKTDQIKVSSYCPIEKRVVNRYPKRVRVLKNRLEKMESIKPSKILLDSLLPILKEKYPNIDLKVIYKKSGYKEASLYLSYNGIRFLDFDFYLSHLSFNISSNLIKVPIETFDNLKFEKANGREIINGIHFDNDPYYITLDKKTILLSVRAIDYNYLTFENIVGFVGHFLDVVFKMFEKSYYYIKKDNIEFFVTHLEDKTVYVKDFKYKKYAKSDFFSTNIDLKKSFSYFKKSFEYKIPRLKKESSRNYSLFEG